MTYKQAFNRIAASIIAVTFFVSNHFSLPLYAVTVAPAVSTAQAFPGEIKFLQIPESIGKIEDAFQGASNQSVIVIQDAHAIPDAQRSIEKIIEHFQKNYGVNLIGLEGANSALDPQIFKSFPDKELLKKVFANYMDEGELTGGTAAAIFSDFPATFHGVENWALYERGLGLYLAAMQEEGKLSEKLNNWKKDLEDRKKQIYSKKLLEVDEKLTAFQKHNSDLLGILQFLASIKLPQAGTELAIILEESWNKRDDFAAAEALEVEVKQIAKKVKASLKNNKDLLSTFNQKEQQFHLSRTSPHEFALFLNGLIQKNNLPIQISSELLGGMKNQQMIQNIEGTKFFNDFKAYAKSVKDSLIQNDEQRKIDEEADLLNLVQRLAKLELSREDWLELKAVNRELWIGDRGMNADLKFHFAFYENAEKRDDALLNKLIKLMNEKTFRTTTHDTRSTNHALLVAGGFHAHGLTQSLKAKNISYALIIPSINKIPAETHYQEQMKGNVSWKNYFKVEDGKINIYQAFVRATRDRLIGASTQAIGDRPSESYPLSPNSYMLKKWRDQIIRDLADQKKIEKAGQYTHFIDETIKADSSWHPNKEFKLGLKKINRFIAGLRGLKDQNRLTEENVMKLLRPSTLSSIAYLALDNTKVPTPESAVLAVREVPKPRIQEVAPLVPAGRAEVRSKEADAVTQVKDEQALTVIAKWVKESLHQDMGFPDLEISPEIENINATDLPHPNGVNVAIFDSVQGLGEVASYLASQPGSQINNVNYILTFPAGGLTFGKDNPDRVYAKYGVIIKNGKIVRARFKTPVPIHSMVYGGGYRSSVRDALDQKGLSLLNSPASLEVDDKTSLANLAKKLNLLYPTSEELDPESLQVDGALSLSETERRIAEFAATHPDRDLFLKPKGGMQGQGAEPFARTNITGAVQHAFELLKRDNTIILQEQISNDNFVKNGKVTDWILRVFTTWENGKPRVAGILVYYNKEGRGVVNWFRGAETLGLDEFFAELGYTESQQKQFLASIQETFEQTNPAIEQYLDSKKESPSSYQHTGVVGWDIMRDTNGKWYILEANLGSIGSLGEIEQKASTDKKGSATAPIALHLKNIGETYRRNHADANDQFGEPVVADSAEVIHNMGWVFWHLGEYSAAEQLEKYALTLNASPIAWARYSEILGNSLNGQQKYTEAAEAFRQSYDWNPAPKFLYSQTEAFFLGKEYVQANEAISKLSKLSSKDQSFLEKVEKLSAQIQQALAVRSEARGTSKQAVLDEFARKIVAVGYSMLAPGPADKSIKAPAQPATAIIGNHTLDEDFIQRGYGYAGRGIYVSNPSDARVVIIGEAHFDPSLHGQSRTYSELQRAENEGTPYTHLLLEIKSPYQPVLNRILEDPISANWSSEAELIGERETGRGKGRESARWIQGFFPLLERLSPKRKGETLKNPPAVVAADPTETEQRMWRDEVKAKKIGAEHFLISRPPGTRIDPSAYEISYVSHARDEKVARLAHEILRENSQARILILRGELHLENLLEALNPFSPELETGFRYNSLLRFNPASLDTPRSEARSKIDEIVQKNVKMIFSEDFHQTLSVESVGGNAGLGHAAVNTLVDLEGRIIEFGNYSHQSPEYELKMQRGELFLVAIRVSVPHRKGPYLIDAIPWSRTIPPFVKQVLKQTLEEVNRQKPVKTLENKFKQALLKNFTIDELRTILMHELTFNLDYTVPINDERLAPAVHKYISSEFLEISPKIFFLDSEGIFPANRVLQAIIREDEESKREISLLEIGNEIVNKTSGTVRRIKGQTPDGQYIISTHRVTGQSKLPEVYGTEEILSAQKLMRYLQDRKQRYTINRLSYRDLHNIYRPVRRSKTQAEKPELLSPKISLSSLVGPKMANAFGKPKIVEISGNYNDAFAQYRKSLERFKDDEMVAVAIHNVYPDLEKGHNRIDYILVIDQAGILKAAGGAVIFGRVKREETEFLMHFSYYPEQGFIFLHNISLGNEKSAAILRGKGLGSEVLNRFAAALRTYYPGLSIATVAAEETFQGQGQGVIPKFMTEQFQGQHDDGTQMDKIQNFVEINFADFAHLYVGKITSIPSHAPRSEARKTDQTAVPFNLFVSALRNHIGKSGSTFYDVMRDRIHTGKLPIMPEDNIGNISNVASLSTFIDEHFAVPEEAVREIITNAYDALRNKENSADRVVKVEMADGFLRVIDDGTGMGDETILKKFFPPFVSGKTSVFLGHISAILQNQQLSETEKLEQINVLLSQTNEAELSDIEKLSFRDIQRINRTILSDDEKLKKIENIAIFTGKFGIGFYSLLYFIQNSNDKIQVITSTGKEAYRISFFKKDDELQTQIDILDPSETPRGTTVELRSTSFSSVHAEKVIREYLSFNANAKISLRLGASAPFIINQEVFEPDQFDHISNSAGVEVFYSKEQNTTGRSKVYINVHGVTILTKEIEGYGMPEKVIFNFPAHIGLPVSRNKILVNDLFLEKAKDMIQLIKNHPALLSAFYPVISILESSGKASYRGILAAEAAQAASESWSHGKVYLPNGEEFSRIMSDRVVLVDRRLLKGIHNDYWNFGEQMLTPSGEMVEVGGKRVYLVSFSDHTKFAATDEAILINKDHEPEINTDRALYNILFGLAKIRGRFVHESTQEPAPEIETSAVQPSGEEVQKPVSADQIATIIETAISRLPADPNARTFVRSILSVIELSILLSPKETTDSLYSLYQAFVKSGLISSYDLTDGESWRKFFWSYDRHGDMTIVLKVLNENKILPQLQTYLMKKGARDIVVLVLTEIFHHHQVSEELLNLVINRMWELRETLPIHSSLGGWYAKLALVQVVWQGLLLDDESYRSFSKSFAVNVNLFTNDNYIMHQVLTNQKYNYAYPSDHSVFEMFMKGDISALERIAAIAERVKQKTGHGLMNFDVRELFNMLAGLSDQEVDAFLEQLTPVDQNVKEGIQYGNISTFWYVFQYIYGDSWIQKLNEYKALPYRGPEIWTMEQIASSSISFAKKKKYIEAIINEVAERTSDPGVYYEGHSPFNFGVTNELLEGIQNPAHFIYFLNRVVFVESIDFLNEKYRREFPGQTAPLGLHYHFRYKLEIMRKLVVIYQQIQNLPEENYRQLLNDFLEYGRSGKATSRIQPYLNYLLSSQKMEQAGPHEINVYPTRSLSLVSVYDTYLELNPEQEHAEEVSSARADDTLVEERLAKAAEVQLNPERREILSAAFKAASKQSVDDLVYLREVIQNVIDEAHDKPTQKKKITFNVYERTPPGQEHANEVLLDIEDKIGMNLARLYDKLLMPFSTTKKGIEKYLGEQGQGFFTLLANSEYVVIKTVKNGKVRLLRITPVRVNGEIVDFDVAEEGRAVQTGESDGTRMQIAFRSAFPELESERIKAAIRKFAGLVDENVLAIEVNGEKVNIDRSRLYASENTTYGSVNFHSVPGDSFIALGGLFVKPFDDDFIALIPEPLRPILVSNGIGVHLPSAKIKRIQGGSDIAKRQEIYEGIRNAVETASIWLVVTMFSRGDISSLNLLGYDYYEQTIIDSKIKNDALAIREGHADMERIRTEYLTQGRQNHLAQLMMSMPLDFLTPYVGSPLSLADLFGRYQANPESLSEDVIMKLPPAVQKALGEIKGRNAKRASQKEIAKSLGVPTEFLSDDFIKMPPPGNQMGAYWAFLELTDAIARIGIEGMVAENADEVLGDIAPRLKDLNKSPPVGHYYANADGLSAAHALQGQDVYAWNLLEQTGNIQLFARYLENLQFEPQFLDLVFEKAIETLSHELIHLLENPLEETHNEIFFKRQKMMVSAMIRARSEIADILLGIQQKYAENHGYAKPSEFLAYVKELRGSEIHPEARPGSVVPDLRPETKRRSEARRTVGGTDRPLGPSRAARAEARKEVLKRSLRLLGFGAVLASALLIPGDQTLPTISTMPQKVEMTEMQGRPILAAQKIHWDRSGIERLGIEGMIEKANKENEAYHILPPAASEELEIVIFPNMTPDEIAKAKRQYLAVLALLNMADHTMVQERDTSGTLTGKIFNAEEEAKHWTAVKQFEFFQWFNRKGDPLFKWIGALLGIGLTFVSVYLIWKVTRVRKVEKKTPSSPRDDINRINRDTAARSEARKAMGDYEKRMWPSSESRTSPLISPAGTIWKKFLNAWINPAAYGGWMAILMMSNWLGGKMAVLAKSLSRVMSTEPSFLDVFAISKSGEPARTREASWPRLLRNAINAVGTSSSITNFMQWISGRGNTPGFWLIQPQSEGQLGRVPALNRGSNPAPPIPLVSAPPPEVLGERTQEFGFPGNKAFHAELGGLQRYISQLFDPWSAKTNISAASSQVGTPQSPRSEAREIQNLKPIISADWQATDVASAAIGIALDKLQKSLQNGKQFQALMRLFAKSGVDPKVSFSEQDLVPLGIQLERVDHKAVATILDVLRTGKSTFADLLHTLLQRKSRSNVNDERRKTVEEFSLSTATKDVQMTLSKLNILRDSISAGTAWLNAQISLPLGTEKRTLPVLIRIDNDTVSQVYIGDEYEHYYLLRNRIPEEKRIVDLVTNLIETELATHGTSNIEIAKKGLYFGIKPDQLQTLINENAALIDLMTHEDSDLMGTSDEVVILGSGTGEAVYSTAIRAILLRSGQGTVENFAHEAAHSLFESWRTKADAGDAEAKKKMDLIKAHFSKDHFTLLASEMLTPAGLIGQIFDSDEVTFNESFARLVEAVIAGKGSISITIPVTRFDVEFLKQLGLPINPDYQPDAEEVAEHDKRTIEEVRALAKQFYEHKQNEKSPKDTPKEVSNQTGFPDIGDYLTGIPFAFHISRAPSEIDPKLVEELSAYRAQFNLPKMDLTSDLLPVPGIDDIYPPLAKGDTAARAEARSIREYLKVFDIALGNLEEYARDHDISRLKVSSDDGWWERKGFNDPEASLALDIIAYAHDLAIPEGLDLIFSWPNMMEVLERQMKEVQESPMYAWDREYLLKQFRQIKSLFEEAARENIPLLDPDPGKHVARNIFRERRISEYDLHPRLRKKLEQRRRYMPSEKIDVNRIEGLLGYLLNQVPRQVSLQDVLQEIRSLRSEQEILTLGARHLQSKIDNLALFDLAGIELTIEEAKQPGFWQGQQIDASGAQVLSDKFNRVYKVMKEKIDKHNQETGEAVPMSHRVVLERLISDLEYPNVPERFTKIQIDWLFFEIAHHDVEEAHKQQEEQLRSLQEKLRALLGDSRTPEALRVEEVINKMDSVRQYLNILRNLFVSMQTGSPGEFYDIYERVIDGLTTALTAFQGPINLFNDLRKSKIGSIDPELFSAEILRYAESGRKIISILMEFATAHEAELQAIREFNPNPDLLMSGELIPQLRLALRSLDDLTSLFRSARSEARALAGEVKSMINRIQVNKPKINTNGEIDEYFLYVGRALKILKDHLKNLNELKDTALLQFEMDNIMIDVVKAAEAMTAAIKDDQLTALRQLRRRVQALTEQDKKYGYRPGPKILTYINDAIEQLKTKQVTEEEPVSFDATPKLMTVVGALMGEDVTVSRPEARKIDFTVLAGVIVDGITINEKVRAEVRQVIEVVNIEGIEGIRTIQRGLIQVLREFKRKRREAGVPESDISKIFNQEVIALIRSLNQYKTGQNIDLKFAIGFVLPDTANESLTHNLLKVLGSEEAAQVDTLVLSGGQVNPELQTLRQKGIKIRTLKDLAKDIVLMSQSLLPVGTVDNVQNAVAETFLPFQIQDWKRIQDPLVKDYVEALQVVALIHAAAILAEPPSHLRANPFINNGKDFKEELLMRLNRFSNFENIVIPSGQGFMISSVVAQAYLEHKTAEQTRIAA